jgi:hypothetical protein
LKVKLTVQYVTNIVPLVLLVNQTVSPVPVIESTHQFVKFQNQPLNPPLLKISQSVLPTLLSVQPDVLLVKNQEITVLPVVLTESMLLPVFVDLECTMSNNKTLMEEPMLHVILVIIPVPNVTENLIIVLLVLLTELLFQIVFVQFLIMMLVLLLVNHVQLHVILVPILLLV